MRNTLSCLLLFLVGCTSPPTPKHGFITATVSSSDATGFGTPSFAGNVFWSAVEGNGPLRNRIRVVLGDQVTVSVSPYDPARGLITFRGK
jgi:hypothetical protein